jgi:hypothetical protein
MTAKHIAFRGANIRNIQEVAPGEASFYCYHMAIISRRSPLIRSVGKFFQKYSLRLDIGGMRRKRRCLALTQIRNGGSGPETQFSAGSEQP